MTYNPNIPAANDILSNSQSQILTNFGQLNTVFGIDHVPFYPSVANSGKHAKVTLPEGGDAATLVNEIALYCKDLSSVSTLYLRKENNGTVIQISGVDPIASAQGRTFLPGGLILAWGSSASVSNGGTVSFASAFPNNCFGVQVTINIASTVSPVGINGYNTSGFTFRTTAGGGVPITYMAIGN